MCVIRCSSGLKLFQIDREMGMLGWGRKGEKVEVVSRKIAKYFESTRMYESRVERTRMENMDQVRRISNRPGMVEMFALWIFIRV